jgi:hypothetical protein
MCQQEIWTIIVQLFIPPPIAMSTKFLVGTFPLKPSQCLAIASFVIVLLGWSVSLADQSLHPSLALASFVIVPVQI